MSTARDEVLGRIRAALGDVPAGERAPDVPVPRGYRHSLDLPVAEIVDLFAERVADYKAVVRRVQAADLAAAVTEILGGRRVGVPAGLPQEWYAGCDVVVDDGSLTVADFDALDGALTGCALGIAETGTIVLDGGDRSGRRVLTLVPDYFLCVVDADQVVGSVPLAMAALRPERPITFVSGPSATSDIELNRVEGVHGPRTLEVLIVDP
ncbi:MAG: LutC/YkgG family protein [Mycobacteriales bacterium]